MSEQKLTKKERKALKRQEREQAKLKTFSKKQMKKMIGWGIIGLVAVFLVVIIIVAIAKSGSREFTFELDAQNPSKGNTEASVVIREFSDFQCPACRSAYFNLKSFMDEYSEKVKFIYYDFPLTSIHDNAMTSAIASRCAETQGKFWEYHDILFERQKGWSDLKDPSEVFASYAKEIEIDDAAFSICLKEERNEDLVKNNLNKAFKLGLNSTPTIFINDEQMRGVVSVEELKSKVDALLAE